MITNSPLDASILNFPKRGGFKFKFLLYGITALFVLLGINSTYYTVPPESEAVLQRFGRYTETVKPGLHFKLPFGIDEATIVPVRRMMKLEFGFFSPNYTNPYQRGEEPEKERDMVTGDLNAAEVEWVVQYIISDPVQYLFHVRNPGETLRDIGESAMCEVLGDRTIDEVLTTGRLEIEMAALQRLGQINDQLKFGIRIEQIQLKDIYPPRPVQASFDDVTRAKQEREQMINEANGEYNRIIPRARGLADQVISGAEGYAVKRINQAQGDVARFNELLVQYDKAPAITKQRLYLETMQEILPKLGSKIILDEDAKQFLPLMNLNQAGQQPASATKK